jgi:hypothetical protein
MLTASDQRNYRYVSAGEFSVDASGAVIGLDGAPAVFAIPEGFNPDLVGGALLTVEAAGGIDSVPGPALLSGVFSAFAPPKLAQLQLNGRDAFGTALDTGLLRATGTFLLETPTTIDATDFAQGIWFIQSDLETKGIPLAAHPLSPLNDHWQYEAWLVHRRAGDSDDYISLGRFRNPDNPDDNGAGPAAGEFRNNAYGTPGEDFVAAGMERTLNDGNYGVIVALAPRDIPLAYPLVPLLVRETIDSGVGRRVPMTIVPPVNSPLVEVTLAP